MTGFICLKPGVGIICLKPSLSLSAGVVEGFCAPCIACKACGGARTLDYLQVIPYQLVDATAWVHESPELMQWSAFKRIRLVSVDVLEHWRLQAVSGVAYENIFRIYEKDAARVRAPDHCYTCLALAACTLIPFTIRCAPAQSCACSTYLVLEA